MEIAVKLLWFIKLLQSYNKHKSNSEKPLVVHDNS